MPHDQVDLFLSTCSYLTQNDSPVFRGFCPTCSDSKPFALLWCQVEESSPDVANPKPSEKIEVTAGTTDFVSHFGRLEAFEDVVKFGFVSGCFKAWGSWKVQSEAVRTRQ